MAQLRPIRFENYTTENGLPQNSGYSIAQTPEGFMWFGTQDGLCRYDGTHLVVYKNEPGDSLSLCANQINALCTDTKGNLWIGTSQGVCIYNRLTDHFELPSAYWHTDKQADHLNATGLLQVDDDHLCVVTADKGLFLLQKNKKEHVVFFSGPVEKLSLGEIKKNGQNRICIISGNDLQQYNGQAFEPLLLHQYAGMPDKDFEISHFLFAKGFLWLSTTHHGLLKVNLVEKTVVEKIDIGNKQWHFTKNELTDLLLDHDGNMWVGTSADGIYKYNEATAELTNGRYNAGDKFSLTKNYVIALFEDKQGIIWIGTSGGGIAKYDVGRYVFQLVPLSDPKGKPAPDNMVMSLYNAGANGFVAGTQSGGMMTGDRHFANLQFYKNKPNDPASIVNDYVYQTVEDDKDNLWIATVGGLCSFNRLSKKFKSYVANGDQLHQDFYCVAFLKEENALVVSGSKGLFRFNLQTKQWTHCKDVNGYLGSHLVFARYLWAVPGKDIVWICSEGLGLLQYNLKTGIFTEYLSVKKSYSTIRHLYKNNDSVWLATDFGLVLMSEKNDRVMKVYDSKAGLTGNVVYAVLPDKSNNLWMSSNHGIFSLNLATQKLKNFDEGYGLQGAEFNTAACCTDEAGHLYFGGINGINYFLPQEIPVNNYSSAPLITCISVMNSPLTGHGNVAYLQTLELPYNKNFISFEYANPNYSHTDNNVFSYRLQDIDADWVKAGNKTFATYTNLPPGKYTFAVKAANNEGTWSNKTASVTIIIHPPFWAMWWFRTICLLAAIAFAGWLYRLRIKNIRRLANVDRQLSVFEMKALHAQMNPHFIFNCLNSIKEMILLGETANASTYLSSFAQMIRDTLDQSKETFVSLEQSLNHLRRYIEMEEIRIEDFSYQVKVSSDINTNEVKIPPMLLQPLVENAIWHGLQMKATNKILKIEVVKEDDKICFLIDDNGAGFNQTGKQQKPAGVNASVAIKNIQQRIHLLNQKFKTDCSLTISDKTEMGMNGETGTVAKLVITGDLV